MSFNAKIFPALSSLSRHRVSASSQLLVQAAILGGVAVAYAVLFMTAPHLAHALTDG